MNKPELSADALHKRLIKLSGTPVDSSSHSWCLGYLESLACKVAAGNAEALKELRKLCEVSK